MLRVAEHYAATDTGRQRRANEDSMLARAPLFVVADGMGGARAGEVASRIAIDTFGEPIEDLSDPAAALARQAHAANERIHARSHADAAHAGMGTTVTAAYIGEREVTVAHVGDSRAYCMRDGRLMRLTEDHSLVDELIRQGRLTPEEAEEHPQRSIITRALGPEPHVEVDTRSFRAKAGDVYLLCSDGLTSMVPERALAEIMNAQETLRETGEALIEAANQAGGKDNITVVLLRLEEVSLGGNAQEEHTTEVTLGGEERAAGSFSGMAAGRSGGAVSATTASALSERPSGAPREQQVPRRPRRAPSSRSSPPPRRRGRRLRWTVISASSLAVLCLLAVAAYIAVQSVFFIGTNSTGLVTIYRGLPYVLPGGVSLYTVDYVSGVSASTLSPARRQGLLDHSLRSEKNAGDLVRKLELGQLGGGEPGK